jgi:hypothetical protein
VECTGNDWFATRLYLTTKPQGCGGIKGDLLEFSIIPETEHVEHPVGGGPPQLLIKTGLNGTTFFGPKRTRLAAAWQAKRWDAHFGDASRCSPPDFSTCITAVSGELVMTIPIEEPFADITNCISPMAVAKREHLPIRKTPVPTLNRNYVANGKDRAPAKPEAVPTR